jgi:hypothetical protein
MHTTQTKWKTDKGLNMNEVIDMFPDSLRTRTRMILHAELVNDLPWFRGVHPDFIKHIVNKLKTQIIMENEFICR